MTDERSTETPSAAEDRSAGDGVPGAGGPEAGSGSGSLAAPVGRVGRRAVEAGHHAGRQGILFAAFLASLGRPGRYARATVVQAKRIGVDSLAVVLLVAALSGSVLAQQSGYQMTWLPMWVVGQAVAAGTITEMAPLLTAVVLAGRVGAGMAAELGTMKVTDQLDALRTLGRDPVEELVVPRVLAGMLVLGPLVVLAIVVAIAAGCLTSISLLPMTTGEYIHGVREYWHAGALIFSLLKAVAFGFTVSFTACYVGLQTEGGAAGVGRATTKAVVSIIVAVMAMDVVLAPLYKTVA